MFHFLEGKLFFIMDTYLSLTHLLTVYQLKFTCTGLYYEWAPSTLTK